MAHVAKVKAPAVGLMLDHYGREPGDGVKRSNENIDPKRTRSTRATGRNKDDKLGYWKSPSVARASMAKRVDRAKAIHEKTSGRKLRKDANAMLDWCVTVPEDTPAEQMELFFGETYRFIGERYGWENVGPGFIHMDETTPHIHVPFVPLKDGRLSTEKMVNRKDLRSFHHDLQKHLASKGIQGHILLPDEEKAKKALSHIPQADLDAARAELDAVAEERVDSLLADKMGDLLARERKVSAREEKATQKEQEASQALAKAKGVLASANDELAAAERLSAALRAFRADDEEYERQRVERRAKIEREMQEIQERMDRLCDVSGIDFSKSALGDYMMGD